jgi:hypothetical protein
MSTGSVAKRLGRYHCGKALPFRHTRQSPEATPPPLRRSLKVYFEACRKAIGIPQGERQSRFPCAPHLLFSPSPSSPRPRVSPSPHLPLSPSPCLPVPVSSPPSHLPIPRVSNSPRRRTPLHMGGVRGNMLSKFHAPLVLFWIVRGLEATQERLHDGNLVDS